MQIEFLLNAAPVESAPPTEGATAAECEARSAGESRKLGGHTFLFPVLQRTAFVTTQVGIREGLVRKATHIVVGRVAAIYARKAREGGWEVTRYVAEVKTNTVEKGEGVAAGDLIYVRYWHREWRGASPMPESTTGHRGLPEEGETLRIYLARKAHDGFTDENDDGGLNVLGANGFERIP